MDFTTSQQRITWIRDRYVAGRLEIKPPYQRKPVWTAKQKCYLIESILLDLPVPEIYMQMSTTADGETTYAIVDGQQRVRAVLQFIGAEEDPDEQEYNKFALDKLEAQSPWRDLTFAHLSNEDKRRFYDYTFVVRELKTDRDADVRDMFRRLNKYLTPLNAQELRNATYSGPFVKLVGRLTDDDDDYWASNRIVSAAQIRRMKDLEFVSNLLIGVLHGPQGGAASVVNEYYKIYEDYEDEFPDQRKATGLFNKTLACVKSLLAAIKQTRWGNMTDFYTLFVAIASLFGTKELPRTKIAPLRKSLGEFATEIDLRLRDEKASVSENAVEYVRAVEKGAPDKARRAKRHLAMLNVIEGFFVDKGAKR